MQGDSKRKLRIYFTNRVLQGVGKRYQMIERDGIIVSELNKEVALILPKSLD